MCCGHCGGGHYQCFSYSTLLPYLLRQSVGRHLHSSPPVANQKYALDLAFTFVLCAATIRQTSNVLVKLFDRLDAERMLLGPIFLEIGVAKVLVESCLMIVALKIRRTASGCY